MCSGSFMMKERFDTRQGWLKYWNSGTTRARESQSEPDSEPERAREDLCGSPWLSVALSLALSQSERARENICGSLLLSVALSGTFSVRESQRESLWLSLALCCSLLLSLSLWLTLDLFMYMLSPVKQSNGDCVKVAALTTVSLNCIIFNSTAEDSFNSSEPPTQAKCSPPVLVCLVAHGGSHSGENESQKNIRNGMRNILGSSPAPCPCFSPS